MHPSTLTVHGSAARAALRSTAAAIFSPASGAGFRAGRAARLVVGRLAPAHLVGACLALALAPAAAAQDPPPVVKLDRGDPEPGDLYACALDLTASADGLTAVVGSVLDDDRGPDSGSAYVFESEGGPWRRTAKLVPHGVAAGDQAGFAVALEGGRIVLGAPHADPAGGDSGSAWLFRRDGDGWVEDALVAPAGLAAGDRLGHSVAAGGGRVALGAPGDDGRGAAAGAVWLLAPGDDGALDPAGAVELTAAGSRGSGLGTSVAVDARTVAAGAPFDDAVGAAAGAVWVFEPAADGSTVATRLVPPGPGAAGGRLGTSVALAGDLLAAGAPRDGGAGPGAGAVHVFRRTEGGWRHEARLVPPGLAPGDELGSSVGFDGGVLYAGARFDDQVAPDAGAVHRFELRDGSWVATGKLVDPGTGAGDELGFAVAALDGTVLTGAYRSDEAGTDSGQACVLAAEGSPQEEGRPSFTLSKSASAAQVAPGGALVYAIAVANVGDGAGTAEVADRFPPRLGGACTWTCAPSPGAACSARPGDLDDEPFLPPGATVTYTVACTVPVGTGGATLTNTATLTGPGTAGPVRTASAVTRVVAVAPAAFAVSKTPASPLVVPGGAISYSIVVANVGGTGTAAAVADPLPPGIPFTWTCTGAAGGSCTAAGTGGIADTATLPPGGSVTYVAACTVPPSTPVPSALTNTVTVTDPAGVVPPAAATATVQVVAPAEIPTLSAVLLAALGALLAAVGALRLRRAAGGR